MRPLVADGPDHRPFHPAHHMGHTPLFDLLEDVRLFPFRNLRFKNDNHTCAKTAILKLSARCATDKVAAVPAVLAKHRRGTPLPRQEGSDLETLAGGCQAIPR